MLMPLSCHVFVHLLYICGRVFNNFVISLCIFVISMPLTCQFYAHTIVMSKQTFVIPRLLYYCCCIFNIFIISTFIFVILMSFMSYVCANHISMHTLCIFVVASLPILSSHCSSLSSQCTALMPFLSCSCHCHV